MVSYAVVSAHALLRAPAATWVCVMWGRAGVVGGGVRFQGSAFFHECPLQMRALRKPTLGPHVTFFPETCCRGTRFRLPKKNGGTQDIVPDYPRYFWWAACEPAPPQEPTRGVGSGGERGRKLPK